jgi:integrase/recombinase XerD
MAIFWVLWHGLRANEAIALNVEDYNGLGVNIEQVKRDSVGFVPFIGSARNALERYLQWRKEQKFLTEPQSPLFISHSARSKGERLSYRGLHSLVNRLAQSASLEGIHPHRLHHTIANKMAQAGMESLLARQITRHQSESAYERYSQNALRSKATDVFLALFDENDESESEEDRKKNSP